MRKSVGFLISLVGILGVITVYFWYDTRVQLRHIMTAVKPFAEVNYSYIYASPFGSAGIKGLEILPYGVDDKFLIDNVSVQGKNFFSLLTINRAFGQGQLPKSLHVILEDVQIPLDSRLLQNRFGEPSLQLPLEFIPCGGVDSLGPTELQALGYKDLHLNLSLAYDINELKPSMELTVTFNHQTMLAISTKAQLTLSQAMLSLTDLLTMSPRLSELTVLLDDLSLVERLNRFCANKENIRASAYIDKQINYLQYYLQTQGITFSSNLIALYREFMTQGGKIKITASPQRPLPLNVLTHRSLKHTLDMLNLAITVNDLPTTELTSQLHQANSFSDSKKEITSGTIVTPKQQDNTSEYRSITYEELSSYLGSVAIIYTVNGSEHKGKLLAVDHNTLKLARQVRGGSIVFTINMYDIEQILVAP